MKLKICSKCKKLKLVSRFSLDRMSRDGLYRWCKSCCKIHAKIYRKKIKNKQPWIYSYFHAKCRCNNKKSSKYGRYGGRGIKFLLTKKDFEFLWQRDEAWLLKNPSIDRVDNDGHYELSNCRFIEIGFNGNRNKMQRVEQINQMGDLVKIYSYQGQAKENGFIQSRISLAIKTGKLYKGFYWRKHE